MNGGHSEGERGEDLRGPALVETVYAQLRALAQSQMGRERPGHTLQATALVNEAFIRMKAAGVAWSNPSALYHAAAEAMRRILIDHARAHAAVKRGGGRRMLDLSSVLDLATANDPASVLALDGAISRLERVDARAAEVVRLRFYAGLTVDQAAESLGRSRRTVLRDWEFARAWLVDDLERAEESGHDGT
jgi:RNA polymerase sigma factor (TIGR02999 family)